jgi:signal transduction histidine kinase
MKRFSPFWRVGVLYALLETFLVGAVSMSSLMLVSDQLPPDVIGQGFLFLSPTCALWCALRLRMREGRMWLRLLREGVAAVGLSLALGGGLSAVAFALGWRELFINNSLGGSGIVILLIASGPAFLVFRVGVWLWHFWDGLRRKRLLWALTHAHLTLVVLVMLLLAAFSAVEVVATPASGRFESDNLAAVIVARLTHTILPLFGIVTIMTVGALAVVLPPSVILSYFVARRTTRRLETLAAATKVLRGGDLSARVPVAGEDEVAQLQDDFNAMAADLERATGEIQAERDKVAALLQSRRELIANVSHELRTPVATIRGYLESSLAGNNESPLELQHDLEVMAREIERLQGLIDDLFTLARAEVNGLALELRPTDAGAVVQRRVEAMASLAWQKGRVEVVAEVPPDLPPALADTGRLEQVLVNLLRNGVRHTPPGGIVAVVVAAEDDTVRIEVRDTGEGVSPDDLPYIWERFYRGASARAEDVPGAGLGLALVKELTEAMGGTVAVESIVGQGSCFTVNLPKSQAPVVAPALV